ncbi:Hypothetical protein A7982_05240 [Minicystis rosea]|nr:Hypothetical protein A7982_05240 [Minicystis rosea]
MLTATPVRPSPRFGITPPAGSPVSSARASPSGTLAASAAPIVDWRKVRREHHRFIAHPGGRRVAARVP